MQLTFHTLDVFTTKRFGGNPLAVVLGADGLTTDQMQTIAREFNLAETIFVQTPQNPAHTAAVRIFRPMQELPFAGHPTVGCAVLLAETLLGPGAFDSTLTLEQPAGLVPVTVRNHGGTTWAQFTAPVLPFAVDLPLPPRADMAAALGLDPADLGPLGLHQGGPRFLYIPVASRAALSRAQQQEPHWTAFLRNLGVVGAYLFTPGGDHPKTSFRARMLTPLSEGGEDPATGSATALFASHLLAGGLADGTHRFRLEQGHDMGRPSDLDLEVDVAGGTLTAVRVAGTAIRVTEGRLTL